MTEMPLTIKDIRSSNNRITIIKNEMKKLLFLIVILAVLSCKKEKSTPILTTSSLTAITKTTGTSGGNITNDGGETIISRGVCWSINNTPTIAGNKTSDGAGAGSFVSTMIGLTPNTTYFVRAYASNASETGYGMALSFRTLPAVTPTLTTATISDITQNSAKCGGTIIYDGAALITARGVCFNTTQNPTTSGSKTSDGTGIGSFVSNLTGLSPATTYYIRAYATNSVGTNYGNQASFKTLPLLPTISTVIASSITSTSASSGGSISSDGGADIIYRGICWSTSANPTVSITKTEDGTGIGSFVSNLTGLSPATTYYIRAYATNSMGTAYGNELSFNTSASTPILMTQIVSFVTANSAKSGGIISSDGGFPITAKGLCWSLSSGPTVLDQKTNDGTGNSNFNSVIIGLQINTIYYIRAYAINSIGIAYGKELTFRTYTGSVTDIDGNVYNTVKIGTQLWMAENLKSTRYADGSSIPLVNTRLTWASLTAMSKAYCWSDDNMINKDLYGGLYTWAASTNGAVSSNTNPSGVQGACPTDWHLPSNAEWTVLTDYLTNNGYGYQGSGNDIAKSMSATTRWNIFSTAGTPGNDQESNNNSCFTALPGGYRDRDGTSCCIGVVCIWWSSTENRTFDAYFWKLKGYDSNVATDSFSMEEGYSVRCVRNY